MAKVLLNLGCEHALVVHGMDGLDEISISDKTKVSELKDGKIKNYFIKPEDLGLKRAGRENIRVQNVEESKVAALDILEQHNETPKMDVVLLNAGAAIYVGGLAKDIKSGIKLAKEAIVSGAAVRKLGEIRNVH
jgi:anthranilate phosphoribosyltransferase